MTIWRFPTSRGKWVESFHWIRNPEGWRAQHNADHKIWPKYIYRTIKRRKKVISVYERFYRIVDILLSSGSKPGKNLKHILKRRILFHAEFIAKRDGKTRSPDLQPTTCNHSRNRLPHSFVFREHSKIRSDETRKSLSITRDQTSARRR